MRITKTIAKEMAKKMTNKLVEKRKSLINQQFNYIDNEIKQSLPTPLFNAIYDCSEYFTKKEFVTIMLKENSYGYHHTTIPCVNKRFVFTDQKKIDFLTKTKYKIEDLQSKIKASEKEITNALLLCKTSNNVNELFPEAIPYLPDEGHSLPSLNIEITRNLVKSLNQI